MRYVRHQHGIYNGLAVHTNHCMTFACARLLADDADDAAEIAELAPVVADALATDTADAGTARHSRDGLDLSTGTHWGGGARALERLGYRVRAVLTFPGVGRRDPWYHGNAVMAPTVAQFARLFPFRRVLLHTNGHAALIRDGVAYGVTARYRVQNAFVLDDDAGDVLDELGAGGARSVYVYPSDSFGGRTTYADVGDAAECDLRRNGSTFRGVAVGRAMTTPAPSHDARTPGDVRYPDDPGVRAGIDAATARDVR